MHLKAFSLFLAILWGILAVQGHVFEHNNTLLQLRAGPGSSGRPPYRPPKQPPTEPDGTIEAPELPEPLVDEFPDDSSVFSPENWYPDSQEALFKNFGGGQDQYLAKVLDVFAYNEYPVTPSVYDDATGSQQPFKSDQPTPTGQAIRITQVVTDASGDLSTQITTFKPSQTTDVCGAWVTLASYCGNAGTDCACYSGTYYVPDQWNSLAAYCAASVTDTADSCVGEDETSAYWCSIAQTAYAYTSYCPMDPTDVSAVYYFAALTNAAAPSSTKSPVQATSTAAARTSSQVASSTESSAPTSDAQTYSQSTSVLILSSSTTSSTYSYSTTSSTSGASRSVCQTTTVVGLLSGSVAVIMFRTMFFA